MYPYIANTNQDKEEMLKAIGVNTLQELFNDVPENVLLSRELKIAKSASEMEVSKKVKDLALKNKSIDDYICFLGAGSYDHYIPSVIKHLVSRSEFYTAYTPYQPEISQGTLQGVFEFQSMICELTGLDVSNVSMYDGPTAAAEAAILVSQSTRRKKVLVSKTVNPETRKVLDTYLKFRNVEYVEIEEKDGTTDVENLKSILDKDTAGVLIQSPNFFGVIEDVSEVEKMVHDNKSLFIMSVDPISLGILKSPGELGADIAVGEGQALGGNMNFGGPCVGFMTTTTKLMRKMPGRIVGQTTDVDDKRGFVLTLQAREQHIRREKATSNICSDQTLNAIAAAIYLATLGKAGIKEVAEQCIKKSHYAYNKLMETGKVKPLFKDKPFFKEFAVVLDKDVDKANEELLDKGILGGYNLSKPYDKYENAMLLCVTENRRKSEIDKLAKVMEVI
ncbi:aminomethyl-transferring glycine dehydrogenase subunit GcvPA [Clostridium sp. MSJ-4]|uniref:Probable glycine dehydrogenase (decarboxylating) subunit 1 n=1 Tax=Clostridium simiarum TaxID=2841506 RepID=A0ABS6F0E1_9CLOT|nr:aminomethyl-transferring glycine dehydrogenase subunit GcvPA [Clostridium simiarum]MBU5591964.1 aminomethyl-transferring glycine dehydrogenase subunit GcvPA [Clostridium simiarum]